ncbi:MAG: hypothetical protein RRZ64_00095 [Rikenellaceae bacterium]
MGRNNATFKYKQLGDLTKGSNGFYSPAGKAGDWLPGCECYVEKHIPAKQRVGTDGQMFTYTYEVFIPKHFRGKLELNAPLLIQCEDCSVDEIVIQGVDNLNRRNIIVWG